MPGNLAMGHQVQSAPIGKGYSKAWSRNPPAISLSLVHHFGLLTYVENGKSKSQTHLKSSNITQSSPSIEILLCFNFFLAVLANFSMHFQ